LLAILPLDSPETGQIQRQPTAAYRPDTVRNQIETKFQSEPEGGVLHAALQNLTPGYERANEHNDGIAIPTTIARA
jgi:hypothetical protein